MGRQIRNTTDTLDRIVVLLLALARLAERAAGAPTVLRWLVLGPLRLADTVAGSYIADLGYDVAGLPPAAQADRHGFDPAGALALALSLRILALTLRAIIKQMRLSSRHPGSAAESDRCLARLIRIIGNAVRPHAVCHDTS
jgi:hypothetical protein